MTSAEIAKLIDHALLHPTLTDQQLREGCELAALYQTASVCIKPSAVKDAVVWLQNTGVIVSTVIGFPHGCTTTRQKISECEQAIDEGALELDMVINIGKVLSEDWDYCAREIQTVAEFVNRRKVLLKIIFENDYLSDLHKIRMCEICSDAKVGFVKTSTGFAYIKDKNGSWLTQGATVKDVILMRKHTDPLVHVKASGGIRTLSQLLLLVENGATRIGTASTLQIMEEAKVLPYLKGDDSDTNDDTAY